MEGRFDGADSVFSKSQVEFSEKKSRKFQKTDFHFAAGFLCKSAYLVKNAAVREKKIFAEKLTIYAMHVNI